MYCRGAVRSTEYLVKNKLKAITSGYGGPPMALRSRRLARAIGLRPYNSPSITPARAPNFRLIHTQLRALVKAPDGDLDGGTGEGGSGSIYLGCLGLDLSPPFRIA